MLFFPNDSFPESRGVIIMTSLLFSEKVKGKSQAVEACFIMSTSIDADVFMWYNYTVNFNLKGAYIQ